LQPNTSRLPQNALRRALRDDTQVNYWTRGDGRALLFFQHTQSTTQLGCGIVTRRSTAKSSDSGTTSSPKTCPKLTKSKSSQISLWLRLKGYFLDHLLLPWLKAQSQIPSTMWLQTSEKMGTMTPNGTPSAMLHTFYGVN
jgi:hypothetical protein